jgi:rubrerythrin
MTAQQLRQMLEDHLVRIEKFQEHLEFAIKLIDDPKLQAVFGHLISEETEHAEEIQALLQDSQAFTSAPAGPDTQMAVMTPVMATHMPEEDKPSATGHFQRRDQNVLTVGNLFGQRQ